METADVFLSVGTATDGHETFVRAIEDRLRSEGLTPHTAGRNAFNSERPLLAVTQLMDKCCGAVVVALERSYFPAGIERRGGKAQKSLSDVVLPTPWNQMEAAMAYSRDLPLIIIVEKGLKCEGMLQQYDWNVQALPADPSALHTVQFNGVLADWKDKVLKCRARQQAPKPLAAASDPSQMTIGELIGRLKPSQLWSVLVALGALVAGAFALGVKLSA